MGINVRNIQTGLSGLRKMMGTEVVGATKPIFHNVPKNLSGLRLATTEATNATKVLSKSEILSKYCAEQELELEVVNKYFSNLESNIDEVSVQRLLKLTKNPNNEFKLYTPNIKRKIFDVHLSPRGADTELTHGRTKGLLNYFEEENKEGAGLLKQLLALQEEGKVSPENIAKIIKMQHGGYGEECKEFIQMLKAGEATNESLETAMLMMENYVPIKALNPKNLSEMNRENLRDLTQYLTCGGKTDFTKAYLRKVNQVLLQGKKVNSVPKEISERFISELEGISSTFAKAELSIADLSKAGGINLTYPRSQFKQNINEIIKDLSPAEQERVLAKFGLAQNGHIMSGLPVAENSKQLSEVEKLVNNEVKRFLNENQIILPKGYEQYQQPLERIFETFPELKFTVGLKQNAGHDKYLSEHILSAFQENVKNPLYAELNASDRRILDISTLLHDINKTELVKKDIIHPMTSAETAQAVVKRMKNLTPAEKDRIVDFVKNHHWLEQIKAGEEFNPDTVKDLAYAFRSGNDFKMAKIFAESDLKAGGSTAFSSHGHKLDTPMIKAIEDKITSIQANGRMVFSADINLDKAIEKGVAKQVTIGTGENATTNWVAKASDLGLDTQNVVYHVPGKLKNYERVITGCQKDGEAVLSASFGRIGHDATYGNAEQFVFFRRINQDNICSAFERNTKYNKTYNYAKRHTMTDPRFSNSVRNRYQELTGSEMSKETYASLYRELSSGELNEIHSNPITKKLLGENAKSFEQAVNETNEKLVSGPTIGGRYNELVIVDPEIGGMGSKTLATEIQYDLRKFAQDNKLLIVEEF